MTPASDDVPRVVYLAGFGRSGSTLLERMLGGIPGWTHVGELVDLARSVAVKHERCGCGLPFDDCPVWCEVARLAFGDAGWQAPQVRRLAELRLLVARQRQLPRLLAHRSGRLHDEAFASLLREYQDGYGRIYRAVAEVTGCRVLVDASKGPAHGLALAGGPGYRLEMVNVVRDPRAVAYSWSRRSIARPQAAAESPDAMWKISVLRSAAQWSVLQGEVELLGRAGLVRARLRHEDLVDRPASALSSVLTDLGFDAGPGQLAHVEGRSVRLELGHGLSGNPGRYDTGSVELRPDEGWRTGLSPREQATVTAVCLPLLLRYGYPVVVPRTSDHITRRAA